MTVFTETEQAAYFQAQAVWTGELRAFLYRRIAVGGRRRALDVGCGDGWLTAELATKVREEAVGCDNDETALAAARAAHPALSFVRGEPAKLPFPDGCFDLVCCHFTLLWAADPPALLAEMRRVAAPGGVVTALAEPDWGGFIEWPELGLRELLCAALAAQGAEPLAGRRLREWFGAAGLTAEIGFTAGPWRPDAAGIDTAWLHHRRTLAGFADERRLRLAERRARRAWETGERVEHLPIAWAVADQSGK